MKNFKTKEEVGIKVQSKLGLIPARGDLYSGSLNILVGWMWTQEHILLRQL